MKLLESIRIIDLTNVLSGPFATLHLALLGAEVIKIEVPDGGDLARKLGNVPKLNKELMGTSFLAQNANKKSLTLNLKMDEGKEIFRKLLKTADVVVENPTRSGLVSNTQSVLRSRPPGAIGPRQSHTLVVCPNLSSHAAICRMPTGAIRLTSVETSL